MKIKHNLQKMLLYIILLTTTVPVLIFGSWIMFDTSSKIENVMKDNLVIISENQIKSLNDFAVARRDNLNMLSQLDIMHDSLQNSLAGTVQDVSYIQNIFSQRKQSNSFIASISLIDKNFKVVCSSENFTQGEISLLKNTGERYKNGDFFISHVIEREEPNGEKIRVVIAYIGVYDDGDLIGYIVEEIYTSYFDSMRTNALLGKHATIYLLDEDNNIITAGQAGGNSIETFSTTQQEREEYSKIWQSIDHTKNHKGEFSYHMAGREWITYYSNIDHTDWCIRVSMDASHYNAQIENLKLMLMIIFIIIFIVSLGSQLLINKHILSPLNKITDVLLKVQNEQDYSARVEYIQNSEIGYVAHQLNYMLELLEKEKINDAIEHKKLTDLAQTDPLTMLLNKRAFRQAVDTVTENPDMSGKKIAFGFVDVDDFKNFNTWYGHRVGDYVLEFVANTLSTTIDGKVGRIGGDEFVFFMDNETAISKLDSSLTEYAKIMNSGVYSDEQGDFVKVTCSIGVAVVDMAEQSYEDLSDLADKAMYTAKNQGKNTHYISYE